MIKRFEVQTTAPSQLIDITEQVKGILKSSPMASGIVVVFVPHTTCGLTINEHADPDVKDDILMALDELVPKRDSFKHCEGNSHAHIKASMMGSSVTVMVESSTLVLGTWQGIFFAEFDGPRQRSVLIKMMPDHN